MNPKVIIATTAFAPHVGGAEVAVQEYIKRLKSDFDFVVVTARLRSDLPKRDEWNGVPVVRVGWGSFFDKWLLLVAVPWYAGQARRASEGKTLVWAIMASYAGAGALLARVCAGVPYALTLQEGDNLPALEDRIGGAMPLFRKIFERARTIQVIAPFLGEWAKKLGAHREPICIPNGVATHDFSIPESDRAQWRARVRHELGITNDAHVVLTVSRLVEKNGISDLLSAVERIPNMHVIVVGEGKLEDSLRAQCASYYERVHFVGTHSAAKIVQYGAAADIFCRPSLTEGFGNVFLEAFCMGLPVVATRVGGIPTIVTHEKNGMLVEPRDINGLVGAFQRMTADEPFRNACIAAGRETARAFDWDLLAPRMATWLRGALD